MWVLLVVLFLIGLMMHPWQVRLHADFKDQLELSLYWIPLRWINKNFCVFHTIIPPEAPDKNKIVYDSELGQLNLIHSDGSPVSAEELAAQIAANNAANKDNKAPAAENVKSEKKQTKENSVAAADYGNGNENLQRGRLAILLKYSKNFQNVIDKLLNAISLHNFKLHVAYGGNMMYCALGAGAIYGMCGAFLGILSTKLRRFPTHPDVFVNWQSPKLSVSLSVEASTNLFLVIKFVIYAIIKGKLFTLLKDISGLNKQKNKKR